MRSTSCPLCAVSVDDDDSLKDHLAVAHDLVDDPGRTTRLDDLDGIVRTEEAVAFEPPSLRVFDPNADDAKWRPLAIGLGGVVLLALVAAARCHRRLRSPTIGA